MAKDSFCSDCRSDISEEYVLSLLQVAVVVGTR